jgi:hypothetical protein
MASRTTVIHNISCGYSENGQRINERVIACGGGIEYYVDCQLSWGLTTNHKDSELSPQYRSSLLCNHSSCLDRRRTRQVVKH